MSWVRRTQESGSSEILQIHRNTVFPRRLPKVNQKPSPNSAARTAGDIGINTRINNAAYQVFNPLTTAPVRGVNWEYSPTFGQPQAPQDYQPARLFNFSVGIRF